MPKSTDNRPSEKDLLSKLLKYKRVIDAPNSVTYIPDFINALSHLLAVDATGTYNCVCKTPLYYPDLMDEYKKLFPKFNYDVINLAQLNMVRTNLVLSAEKLEKTGFLVRSIKDILPECVNQYVNAAK